MISAIRPAHAHHRQTTTVILFLPTACRQLSHRILSLRHCPSACVFLRHSKDCIEAGLPYEWGRLNMDSTVEAGIVRALFLSTTPTHTPDGTIATTEGGDPCPESNQHENIAPQGLAGAPSTAVPHEAPAGGGENGNCNRMAGHDVGSSDRRSAASTSGRGDAGGAGRWNSVRLKEVKELAPPEAEYWQIKMVLGRLKSGWSGYSR